jgi:hypothetical protein
MAVHGESLHIGSQMTAGVDLSANIYRFVRITAANVVGLVTAATQVTLGLQNNKPLSGQVVDVVTNGVTKMVAGAAIAAGAEIMPDSTGRGITAVTAANRTTGAIALEAAAAAGDVITVFIGIGQRVI